MTTPLTPALALAYLRELSVDVRAAVVLDRAGAVLAGEEALAPRVRALPAAADGSVSAAGDLLVARTPDGGAIAAIAGEFAVRSLLEHDLRAAAVALATTAPDPPEG